MTSEPMSPVPRLTALENNSSSSPCAYPAQWHDIDWRRCFRWMKKIQARIAKAASQQQWRVVQQLQRLLARSRAAKLIAVRRVTSNRGKQTPGVDGEIWNTPERKLMAADSLTSTGYRASPLRRVSIPKPGSTKKRRLHIPTMYDRAMQCLYKFALEPVAEATADPFSYGFRPLRSTHDALSQCFKVLGRKGSAPWVLEGDIRSCFDEISHAWLQEHIPLPRSVLCQWLKAGFLEHSSWHPTQAGTPQGGIISPVLANMTLDGLDQRLRQAFPKHRGQKVHLIRYADDFLITAVSKELLEQEVRPLVEAFLAERGLSLSQEKTKITHIQEGFDFLGQHVRKYGDQLLIKPSKESQKRLRRRVKETIRKLRGASQEALIHALNPILRGWAHYHRHAVSKRCFSSIDYWVWQRVWKWACRRHRNKPKKWVLARYFNDEQLPRHRFVADKRVIQGKIRKRPIRTPTGEPCRYPELFRLATVPIQRHVQIRREAHPFDPSCELYLERRFCQRAPFGLGGMKLGLWRQQRGVCPICGQRLIEEEEEDWDVHHLQFRVHGGEDRMSNLVLLHLPCHRLVHSRLAAGLPISWQPKSLLEP